MAKSWRLSASRMIELVGVILIFCRVTPGVGFCRVGAMKLVFPLLQPNVKIKEATVKTSKKIPPGLVLSLSPILCEDFSPAFRIASPEIEYCCTRRQSLLPCGFISIRRLHPALTRRAILFRRLAPNVVLEPVEPFAIGH